LLNRFPKILGNYFIKGIFTVFILMNVIYAGQQLNERYTGRWNESSKFLAFREIKGKLPEYGVHKRDTVICIPGLSQLPLYLVDLNGWTEYIDDGFMRSYKPIYYNHDSIGIDKSISKGAKYLFVLGIEEIYKKPFLMDFAHSLVGKYNDLLIFDLRSKNMNFKINRRQVQLEYLCDMERLSFDKKYLQTSNDSILLKFGRSQTAELAFEGSYSSKLKPDRKYLLSSTIKKVHSGESFQISAWVHDPRDHFSIIASSDDPYKFYYNSKTIEIEDSLGWKYIKSEFFIPEEVHNMPIEIYLHYTGSDSSYIDNIAFKYFNEPDLDWQQSSRSNL
jgi:hypothetical protein